MALTGAGEAIRPSTLGPVVDATLTRKRAVLWGLIAAKVVAIWGGLWDIQWHVAIGRDTFWIPPHVMLYAGVALMVVLSFGVLALTTLFLSWRDQGVVRILGVAGSRGFHLAAWGISLTVLAAPLDDLWHRLVGNDVMLWGPPSPPHALGGLGILINTLGCFVIAREVYPAVSRAGSAALVLFGAVLYLGLDVSLARSFMIAYVKGGFLFHSYSMLAPSVLPLALVVTARLSRSRWAPALVIVGAIALSAVGTQIATVGLDLLQPESIVKEEIAKDPDSLLAVAHAVAQKNGVPPGAIAGLGRFVGLVAAGAMILVDPRRRAVSATVAYAFVLVLLMTARLGSLPAYEDLVPGVGATLLALVVALAGGAVGGWVSERVAALLDRAARAR